MLTVTRITAKTILTLPNAMPEKKDRKPLIPAEVRKNWDTSTVANPMTVIRRIFNKAKSAKSSTLVERCVKEGVLKSTATVGISKLKRKMREGRL